MITNFEKTYIFDTNVLIDDHESIYRYDNSLIIIPIVVLEELDKLKIKDGKVGEAARRVNRELEKLREQALSEDSFLSRGFELPNGSCIKVWAGKATVMPEGLDYEKNDNQILMVAYQFKKISQERNVILISNDINVRVKADGLGIRAQKHDADELSDQLYSGVAEEIFLPKRVIDNLYKTGFMKVNETYNNTGYSHVLESLHENMYGCIKSIESDKSSALIRYNRGHDGEWIASKIDNLTAFGIKGRNSEQRFALDALLDPDITLVTLVGAPGTGKTFMALAAALEVCHGGSAGFVGHPDDYRKRGQKGKRNKKRYNHDDYDDYDFYDNNDYLRMKGVSDSGGVEKIVVTKPIVPMGREIGFLPGPQPLDAKILTPSGWKTMGDMTSGELVIGRDGKPKKVIEVFPKGEKQIFEVKTSDGRRTRCCEDHLWFTQTLKDKKNSIDSRCTKENWLGSVKTTAEIKETLRDYSPKYKGRLNHFLPKVEPVEFNSQPELPIPPYTLGVLLGDGSICGDSILFASVDDEIINRVKKEVDIMDCKLSNYGNSISYYITSKEPLYNNKPARAVFITHEDGSEEMFDSIGRLCEKMPDVHRATLSHRCENNSIIDGIKYQFAESSSVMFTNVMKNRIYELGLGDIKSETKFVPKPYLTAPVKDRIDLLRGLMDTDGSCKESTGEAYFYTASESLRDDIIELVRSLGGSATFHTRDRIGKKSYINDHMITTRLLSYVVYISLPEEINPFFLERKASRFKSKYSHGIKIESVEPCGTAEVQCILVESEDHLYVTDDYIVTHNTTEEKMGPWLQPIWDNLENLVGRDNIDFLKDPKTGIIEINALTHIRGRSIANSFMIVDECQNISKHEIKTILTRMSEGSKIILTGDVEQIDNGHLDRFSNGLTIVLEKFKDKEYAAHITLKEGQRLQMVADAAELL